MAYGTCEICGRPIEEHTLVFVNMIDRWVNRPWGRYKTVWESPKKKIKILEIFPHQRLSLQYHKHRKEIWHLVQGEAMANINGMNIVLDQGARVLVGKETIHRISNRGTDNVVVIEIQEGVCRERDIIRLEDDYGRVEQAGSKGKDKTRRT